MTRWQVGAVLAATLSWFTIVGLIKWYQTPSGYLAYWTVAQSAALILEIVVLTVPSSGRLFGSIGCFVRSAFQKRETTADWIDWFFLICFYGIIGYLILMAPFGLLCHLGIRACGR